MKNLLRHLLTLAGIALGFVAMFVLIARAEKPASQSKAPDELPKRMDPLTAARLDAALNKVAIGQQRMRDLQAEFAPAVQAANDITTRYKVKLWDDQGRPLDAVNFETGEITRAVRVTPPQAPQNKVAQTAAPSESAQTARK